MTPSILNLLPANGTPGTSATGVKPGITQGTPLDGTLFNAFLKAQVAALTPKITAQLNALNLPGLADNVDAAGAAAQTLAGKISALLKSGVSPNDVVQKLATSLANSLASKLQALTGAPLSTDLLNTIQSAFANAIAFQQDDSPDPSPPDERAAALASRVRSIAGLVSAGVNGTTGQQNRFLGNDLDAVSTARATPAPTKTDASASLDAVTLLNAASGSLAAIVPAAVPPAPATPGPALAPPTPSATPALARTAPVTTPPSAPALDATRPAVDIPAIPLPPPPAGFPAPSGTGASVAFDAADAKGTGGDTLLGRVLTRATLASPTPAGNHQTGPAQFVNPGTTAALQNNAATAFVPAGTAAASAPVLADPALSALSKTLQNVVASVLASAPAVAPVASAATANAAGDDTTTRDDSASGSTPVLASLLPAAPPDASTPATTPVTNAPPVPQAVDPQAIVDQVLRGIQIRSDGSNQQVRLRLVPEHLGDVTVNLKVDGAGNVNASLVAQTAHVRDVLLANSGQLTRSLADAGLNLQGFSVDVSGGGSQGQPFGQQPQHQPQARFLSIPALAVNGGSDDAVTPAMPSFGPPIVAPALAGKYDYLA